MKKFLTFTLISAATILVAVPAFAEDITVSGKVLNGFAAALAIGLGALGGALGQGRAAASALEGIARNPAASGKIFVPMIIGLALIESLVIYCLLIAFKLTA
jgi:F-type H+-transporting ATPase subunit c